MATITTCKDIDCKNNKNEECTLEEISIDDCSGCDQANY